MKTAVPFLLMLVLLSAVCSAQEANADQSVDPKAEEALRNLAKLLQNSESIRLQSSIEVSARAQDFNQQVTTEYSIAAQRPNKFALVIESGTTGATIMCDGKSLYTYMPMMREYTVEDAPVNFENLTDQLAGANMAALASGGIVIVDAFFASNPYERILDDIDHVKYVGIEKVGNTDCHRLTYLQQEVPVDIWIETGDQAFLRQLIPSIPDQENPTQPGAQPIKMSLSMRFGHWKVNPQLKEKDFTFVPPNGSNKVDSFYAGMMEPPKHPMTGEKAPEIELDLLDGEKFSLADHEGKDIVILDFWASWCKPCIMAFPMLIEVAEEYKDKNVVFYAVNQGETPDRIRRAMEKKKWDFQVPLDRDGKASKSLQVMGIPHTFVIDKDGIIQVVHIGFLPNLKEKLSNELDQILLGKSLVEPKNKQAKNGDAG